MFEEYTKEILTLIGVLIAGLLITEYGIWRGKTIIAKTFNKIFPEIEQNE